MSRRGRGFNPREVANLRSWGVEPRPDEIEQAKPGDTYARLERSTNPGLDAKIRAGSAITEAVIRAYVGLQNSHSFFDPTSGRYRPLDEPDDNLDVK